MTRGLAESYPQGGQSILTIRLTTLLGVASVVFISSFLLTQHILFVLLSGVLIVGLFSGYTAANVRDAVVDTGIAVASAGILLVTTPTIVPALFPETTLIVSTKSLILILPILIVASIVVALCLWYLDWYLTLRHGSSYNALKFWVSGQGEPALNKPSVIPVIALVVVGLVGVVVVGGMFLNEPTTSMSPSGTSSESEKIVPEPSARVNIGQQATDTGVVVEVYVYSMKNTDVVTVENRETGERIQLNYNGARGTLSATPSDEIIVMASNQNTSAEVSEYTVG